jgi:tetratricopeptide (TPR) repeat protein
LERVGLNNKPKSQGSPQVKQLADVVLLIHGTGDTRDKKEPRWWQKGSAFSLALAAALPSRIESGPEVGHVIRWTGRNSERDRRDAGKTLLEDLIALHDVGRNCHLIGHSHGGSVIFHALVEAERRGMAIDYLRSICTVGTPFLTFRPKPWTLLAAIPLVAACLAAVFGCTISVNLVLTALLPGGLLPSWVLLLWAVSIMSVAVLLSYGFWRLASFARSTWLWSRERTHAASAIERHQGRWRVLASSEDEAIAGLMSSLRLDGEIAPRLRQRDDTPLSAAKKHTWPRRILSQALAVPTYLIYATYNRVIARGLIDPFIWSVVRNKAFGADIPNLTLARVSRFPFSTTFDATTVDANLDDKLIMSANASVAAFAPAMRRYFGQAAELGWLPEQLLAKVKSELSMRELVHTGYFYDADFLALLVDHIYAPEKHAIAGLQSGNTSPPLRVSSFPWLLHLATQTVPTMMIWSLVLLGASAYAVRVEPITPHMQVRDAMATPRVANAATTEFGTALKWFQAVVQFGQVDPAVAAASTIVDPSQRMQAYIQIASLLPVGEGRKKVLERALDNASAVDDPLEQARLLEAIADVSPSSLSDNQMVLIWDRVSDLVHRSHESLGNNSQKAEEFVVTRLARAGRYELASNYIKRFYAGSGFPDVKSVLRKIAAAEAVDRTVVGATSDRDFAFNARLYLAAASFALDGNQDLNGKAMALKALGFADKMENQAIANSDRWNIVIEIVRQNKRDLADMAVEVAAHLTDTSKAFEFAKALMENGYTSLAAAQFLRPEDRISEFVRRYGNGGSERPKLADAILSALIDQGQLDEATGFFKSLSERDTPFVSGYRLGKANLSISRLNEALDIVRLNKGLLNSQGVLLADIQHWCAENDPQKLDDVWANISAIINATPDNAVTLDWLWSTLRERHDFDSQQRVIQSLKDPVAAATYRIEYVREIQSQGGPRPNDRLEAAFSDAEGAIASLPTGDSRAWEFSSLASRLASLAYAIREVDRAEKLFRQAFALTVKGSRASDLAEALAAAAAEPWAQELAQQLSSEARKEFNRLEPLVFVRNGDSATALSRLAAFPPGQDLNGAINDVAVAFAKKADVKNAIAAANIHQDDYSRSATLKEATLAIVEDGNASAIIEINETLSDDRAAGGLLDAALKAVGVGEGSLAETLVNAAMERIEKSLLQSPSNSELRAMLLIDAACVQGRLGHGDVATAITERALAQLPMANRFRLRLDQDVAIQKLLDAKLYVAAAKVALTTDISTAEDHSDSLIVALSDALADNGDIQSLAVALKIGNQGLRLKQWSKVSKTLIDKGDAGDDLLPHPFVQDWEELGGRRSEDHFDRVRSLKRRVTQHPL